MVIDSSALVAVLLDEPEREQFTRFILHDARRLIGAPTLFETAMVLTDRNGRRGISILRKALRDLSVVVTPFGEDDCRTAVRAIVRYGRGRHPARLNFGDCTAYAVAKNRRQRLLFKGDDFSMTDVERAA
jgi:ribonuclease VapC